MVDHRCEPYSDPVTAKDIQVIGEELGVKWDDGAESFIRLQDLRRACPCAGCKGETDVMGNVHRGPEQVLSPASFQLRQLQRVGSYGLQPVWGDGHATGIFTWKSLRNLAEND